MIRKGKFGTVDIIVEGESLKVGDTAPNFMADNLDLSPYNFYEEEGSKIKILSVVPSLDTDVCELQTKMFQKASESFSENISIITISNDLPFGQLRFREKRKLPNIKFVSDYNKRDFSNKYGTLIKELKLQNRSVFVVDSDNKIRYVQYLEQNTDLPEYEEAIRIAKELDK